MNLVGMGWRPGGNSSSVEISRSPYKVSDRVLGIGVADNTREWGLSKPCCLNSER